MRSFMVLAVLMTAICWEVKAQDNSPGREVVMYDPLFWKDELKIKNSQSRKIEEINREFYDGLRRLKTVPHSKSEMKNQLNIGLQERSIKIWATLDQKQKRKLEKILEHNSIQGP